MTVALAPVCCGWRRWGGGLAVSGGGCVNTRAAAVAGEGGVGGSLYLKTLLYSCSVQFDWFLGNVGSQEDGAWSDMSLVQHTMACGRDG